MQIMNVDIQNIIIQKLFDIFEKEMICNTDELINSIPEFRSMERSLIYDEINRLYNFKIIKGKYSTNQTYPSLIYLDRRTYEKLRKSLREEI
jgi:hypothetical protein